MCARACMFTEECAYLSLYMSRMARAHLSKSNATAAVAAAAQFDYHAHAFVHACMHVCERE